MLGLLLVDHGSRRAESNAQLDDMARLVQTLRPAAVVRAVHMEIAEPTIAQGIEDLIASGATEIRVLMYFLSDGRHSREDVPALVRTAMVAHPNVSVTCGQAGSGSAAASPRADLKAWRIGVRRS